MSSLGRLTSRNLAADARVICKHEGFDFATQFRAFFRIFIDGHYGYCIGLCANADVKFLGACRILYVLVYVPQECVSTILHLVGSLIVDLRILPFRSVEQSAF